MAKNNYKNIVRAQASSLEFAVAYLKTDFGNELWLNQLMDAASSIREKCKGNDWSVQINDMEIPMDNPKHLKPSKLSGQLKMFVSISMEGSGEAWKNNQDCIKSLRFKVNISGKDPKNAQHFFYTGFHIDKMDNKDDPSEMHPLYHVHFLNDSKIEGIDALSMDVPRLMHHPVDVFLGILLVYANYNQSGYKKMLQNGGFMGLCRESAKHILVPYFNSLSNIAVIDYKKSLCPYLYE